MVAHAVANVPFYSRWLAGVELGRIQGPEDLLLLPLVAKRDLRRVPREEWLARGADHRRLLEFRTSGSTGEPFNIYRSLREDLQLLVFALRSWRELGVRVNDRGVRVASLNGGTWNGRRVVSEEWVRRATAPRYPLGTTSRYGYQWWVTEHPYKGRPLQAFFAAGNGGQIVLVIPELDLVLAAYGGNYSHPTLFTFQREYVPQWLLPAVL